MFFLVCSFGVVDDIIFPHNWPYGASCVFLRGESVTAETILHRFQPNFVKR